MPFYPSVGEGSPTKIDYRKKRTLILTSLLEVLVMVSFKGIPRIHSQHPGLSTGKGQRA